jgi:hypothetical protein
MSSSVQVCVHATTQLCVVSPLLDRLRDRAQGSGRWRILDCGEAIAESVVIVVERHCKFKEELASHFAHLVGSALVHFHRDRPGFYPDRAWQGSNRCAKILVDDRGGRRRSQCERLAPLPCSGRAHRLAYSSDAHSFSRNDKISFARFLLLRVNAGSAAGFVNPAIALRTRWPFALRIGAKVAFGHLLGVLPAHVFVAFATHSRAVCSSRPPSVTRY